MNSLTLSEKKDRIQEPSGFRMQLEEITFDQIGLKWGRYTAPDERVLSFYPDSTAIVSHFRLSDPAGTGEGNGRSIREKQFVVYRERPGGYELFVPATGSSTRTFFELAMSDRFFDHMLTEESSFLARFSNSPAVQVPSFEFTAQMAPAMYAVINDMQHAPYSGHLKGIYLEAKAIELFLMQVQQLDRQGARAHIKLKAADIACLHGIREYMAAHYDQPCSITTLARQAGINQTKLKSGFRALFNTTVFGYLTDLRMEAAKRMLLDEKMYVHEVADRVGYKHPHHFTAAFRKRFGMLPKDLKN